MNGSWLALQLLASVACLVVAWRAFVIIAEMQPAARRVPYVQWLGFGLGYVFLAVCAVGSLMAIWSDPVPLGYAAWPVASALLILCRPRS